MNASTITASITQFNCWVGRLASWCSLLLVLLVFALAILRYLFSIGSIALQELVIYFHGMLFMLAASYTLAEDEHVRVDVFYARFSKTRKAWVNLLGTGLFLWPMCWFIFAQSLDYVLLSWRIQESSSESGGLAYLFLLKSLLLIMPVLVALQGVARFIEAIRSLTSGRHDND